MHPAITMKHWSHHLHDGMLTMRHHIHDHLHSRHFWAGVALTLLIVAVITALFIMASNAPVIYPQTYPYVPYGA